MKRFAVVGLILGWAYSLPASAQDAQLTQSDGVCTVNYATTSQGTNLKLVKVVGDNDGYLVFLQNPAWQSLTGQQIPLRMRFSSLPVPDGRGGVVRHPAHEPAEIRAGIMSDQFDDPTIGFLIDRELLSHLADTSEGQLRWTIEWNDKALTDVMLFKRHMLLHLDRCTDPFTP